MSIKEMRVLTGWSQQKFGDYFGIPKRTIEEWEAQRRKPPQYLEHLIEYKLRNEQIIKDGE